jgi:hypothetical protein
MFVVYTDGSWGIHPALEVRDGRPRRLTFHQAIPVNALLRDFIAYETTSR